MTHEEKYYPCYKTGKTSYPGKNVADDQIRKFQYFNRNFRYAGKRMKRLSKVKTPVRSYQCHFCCGFHITSESEQEYKDNQSIVKENIQIIHQVAFQKLLEAA